MLVLELSLGFDPHSCVSSCLYLSARSQAIHRIIDMPSLEGTLLFHSAGLVRAIIAEGLGISAGALGGLHLVLAGPTAAVASSSQVSFPLH